MEAIHKPQQENGPEINTLLALKSSSSGLKSATLNLSGNSISLKSASQLAKELCKDCAFTQIILADAFLGDDGCIIIAKALKTNTAVLSLDMRGNAIRQDGAVSIGQMLKVNNSITSLNLEWNCVGIWETGIRAISDALAMNSTLVHLDLRNNKIGPQGIQALALGLKSNTTLCRVDLRWNHAGLIGGRSFADLLTVNTVLEEVDLAGNEVPEDISRSIMSGLERNRSRHAHEQRAKHHSESLTSTLQELNLSHQDALMKLTRKLADTDQRAVSLDEKLQFASVEIDESKISLLDSASRFEKINSAKKQTEHQFEQERQANNEKIARLQQELVIERDRRMELENDLQKSKIDRDGHTLKISADLKRSELDYQVVLRDKSNLIQELAEARRDVKIAVSNCEDQVGRAEKIYHNKLMNLQENQEKEYLSKLKRTEEKLRIAEVDKNHFENEFGLLKTKYSNEKRQWQQVESDAELQVRAETKIIRIEFESTVKSLTQQRDSAVSELQSQSSDHHKTAKDQSHEFKRLHEQKLELQSEYSEMKAREVHLVSDQTQSRVRMDELKKEVAKLEADLSKMKSDISKRDDEIEKKTLKHKKHIHERDLIIARLKEELDERDTELDAIDDDNELRIQELSLRLNSILSHRPRKQHRMPAVDMDV